MSKTSSSINRKGKYKDETHGEREKNPKCSDAQSIYLFTETFLFTGDFAMALLGLYWRIWSRLMMSLGENSTGDWRFEKGAFKFDSPSGDEGVDARLEMVAL
jgi:hypothetical protein